MKDLKTSSDTSAFELAAELDAQGRLTAACAAEALARMEAHGLVILTNLLSDAEAETGLALIRETIDDPNRQRCAFASETDNRYVRRDFCSLPSTPPVTDFVATLAQRVETVLSAYCDRSHPLLEVTTLTSYRGSSHQYIHRDPSGVISLFAAVEDVSEQQGGTVFVPGTQLFDGAAPKHGDAALERMELFRARCNGRILWHNLAKLWAMRGDRAAPLAPGEFRDRVFSRIWDEHQPNLLRFVLGKNSQFSLGMLSPGRLWNLARQCAELDREFRLVSTAPRKGTVILYQSDMLHAGPDNRSAQPRRLFSMSIARETISAKRWHDGYSPHPSLIARPLSLGDLLDRPVGKAGAESDLRIAS
jgi:ectoine hydroxylase-related dioxygenase (phytanoyl-CoA dioxygenase family)